jgi:hypothetical protein
MVGTADSSKGSPTVKNGIKAFRFKPDKCAKVDAIRDKINLS